MAAAVSAAPAKTKIPEGAVLARDVIQRLCPTMVVSEPTIGKYKNKMISLAPSAKKRGVISVVLTGGGFISKKYGVNVSTQFGTTNVQVSLDDEKEVAGCMAIDDKIIEELAKPKSWPELTKAGDETPDAKFIRKIYKFFCKQGKFKDPDNKEKGRWPAGIQAQVILPDSEEAKREDVTKFIDHENRPVSIDTLPGKRWSVLMYKIYFVYFQGQAKVGPKYRLSYLKLSKDQPSGGVDTSVLDALEADLDDMNYGSDAVALPPILEPAPAPAAIEPAIEPAPEPQPEEPKKKKQRTSG